MKYKMSVGFSTKKGFDPVSALIRWIEGTEFSHTFITWKCTNINRRKVYEAVGSGSRIISNKTLKKGSKIVEIYQFEVDLEDLFLIDQYTHDNAGTKYGYLHLLGLAWMRFKNFCYKVTKSNKKARNPLKDGAYSQICVEAGAYVVEHALKMDLPGNIEDYGLKEFREFVKTHGVQVPQKKIDQINSKS